MQPTARTSGDMPDIIEKLTDATGLSWNPPPEIPSLLRNGYYTEIPWTRAPHLARHLRDVRRRTLAFSIPCNLSVFEKRCSSGPQGRESIAFFLVLLLVLQIIGFGNIVML